MSRVPAGDGLSGRPGQTGPAHPEPGPARSSDVTIRLTPQASAGVVRGVRPVSLSSMYIPPGRPVLLAAIMDGMLHCVIPTLLSVFILMTPTEQAAADPLCCFSASSPMLGPSRRRVDAVYGGQSRRRPHRLAA